jgi:hypothetical protein
MYETQVTFERWMKMVDEWLVRFFGAGHMDLPDAPWHDWYDSGMEPEDAFHEYEDEGWFF